MTKTIDRDAERAARVIKTARILGVSKRSVYRVLDCEQANEDVFDVFMRIKNEEQALEDELKEAFMPLVKKLVPFN